MIAYCISKNPFHVQKMLLLCDKNAYQEKRKWEKEIYNCTNFAATPPAVRKIAERTHRGRGLGSERFVVAQNSLRHISLCCVPGGAQWPVPCQTPGSLGVARCTAMGRYPVSPYASSGRAVAMAHTQSYRSSSRSSSISSSRSILPAIRCL